MLMCISDHTVDESQPDHLSRTAATFFLQTKEHHKLTQNAMQGIIQGVTCLMQVLLAGTVL